MRLAVIRGFVHDFPWFHRWIGLIGNTLFVIGSVFFLFERLVIPGTWIFVGASFGLMVDSLGEKILRYEDDRRHRDGAATRTSR
jgi:YrhK-like protein